MIPRYTFHTHRQAVILNYIRTKKDWLDILLYGIQVLVAIAGFCFIIHHMRVTEVSTIKIIIMLALGYVASVKTLQFIDLLSQPTSAVITIDKDAESIYIRLPNFKKLSLHTSDLSHIEYALHYDTVNMGRENVRFKRRNWVEVHLITAEKSKTKILHLNSSLILDSREPRREEALLKAAKSVIKKLAKELGIPYINTRTVNEET